MPKKTVEDEKRELRVHLAVFYLDNSNGDFDIDRTIWRVLKRMTLKELQAMYLVLRQPQHLSAPVREEV